MSNEESIEISEILVEDTGHGKKYEVYKNGVFIGTTVRYPEPQEPHYGPRSRPSNG